MRHLITDPVGLPGLLALGVGGLAFIASLFAARRRAVAAPPAPITRKANISWAWIALQSVGIFIAGFGSIRVSLAPGSPIALLDGALVLALMATTVWLFDASSRTMGKNWSIVARTREDHQLVQTGPFAVVRHPIYVALFLFTLAMAIAYGHTRNLWLAVPIFWLGTALRVRHEERLLRAQFGADYEAYAAQVKRFVPGVI